MVGDPLAWRATASDHWLNSKEIIDGSLDPLLAAEVALGGLNRDVAEQGLNLL